MASDNDINKCGFDFSTLPGLEINVFTTHTNSDFVKGELEEIVHYESGSSHGWSFKITKLWNLHQYVSNMITYSIDLLLWFFL